MPVVVVESPAKAKTINKYLGNDYKVLASYGHVRDLPSKDGSVDPEHGFEMTWEVASDSQKHIRAIAEALQDDDTLILATDPDREGEAISWHLEEALRKRRAIKRDTKVSRVVFNAITKSAVTEAMQNPRSVDQELVQAYLARRALDYLVGFNLSPVLWRKLPGAKSAGRVQSVSLRLIVEREMEIEAFKAREYWTVKALLETPRGDQFEARLMRLEGRKLDRYDLGDEAAATAAVAAIQARALAVASVEAKPGTRNPAPPFMTSTLQQEASRKFGFGARQTMNTAQRLYEAGLITYMRTDGIDMAPEAVMAARDAIGQRFGAEYVPDSPRMYKNKAKNAQEAHECIRPTDLHRQPAQLTNLESDQRKLYDLIYKRTIASQMAAARLERTTVEIASEDQQVGLRATGQVVLFDGFLRVYEEGRDDSAEDDEGRLPLTKQGEATAQRAVTPEQHFTQPPPRYTEATLVKRMEELGIGRPSTYASIVTTIQDRGYVRKEKNRLHPEDKGRLVTIFLLNYFSRYVGYDFTAGLEEQLDEISAGRRDYKAVLEGFWQDFTAALGNTAELRITEVLETITDALAPYLFPVKEDGTDPRLCPKCGKGRLTVKTSRSGGAFIGCSEYPDCRYTRPLGGGDEADGDASGPEGRLLGQDDQGLAISLRSGRFGPYVQRGEASDAQPKPPRASIPQGVDLADVDLAMALQLLSLPRSLGAHPEDGEEVQAGIGRFGPYVRHGKVYANLGTADSVFSVDLTRALELFREKSERGGRRGAPKPALKELGEHPEQGGPIRVLDGRYGPYVNWDKINATLPKDLEPTSVTLEQALNLINEKAAKGGGRKKTASKKAVSKKAVSKKATSKKTTTKKAATKKTAAKKTATKKTAAKKVVAH